MHIPANSAAPEGAKYPVIPVGTYLCKVLEVKVKQSEKSGEYWSMQLEIQEGKYQDKFIFDSLFFTPKGLNRFFLVWKRLTGCELDRNADLDVLPDDLFGCKAYVSVINVEEEYRGEKQTKAKVTYDGYSPHEGSAVAAKSATTEESSDDIPF